MQARSRCGIHNAKLTENTLIILVILGGLMIAAGLFGLGYCIAQGFRIRGGTLPADQVQAKLQGLIAVNLGSVALAALGLAVLLAGLLL